MDNTPTTGLNEERGRKEVPVSPPSDKQSRGNKKTLKTALIVLSALLILAAGAYIVNRLIQKAREEGEYNARQEQQEREEEEDAKKREAQEKTQARGTQIALVRVEGGSFSMGSNNGQDEDEQPIHSVIVSPYYIGKYEVTQKTWVEVMGSNPSLQLGENNPVDNISWSEALEFCNRLSVKHGLRPCYRVQNGIVSWDQSADGYRLPTEAEWEFAARGGTFSKGYRYSGSDRSDLVAWYEDNSGDRISPVGQKKPNELGLFDMSGNVWEWCWDWYGAYSGSQLRDPIGPSRGKDRCYRGGSFNRQENMCLVSNRGFNPPGNKFLNQGLRLARSDI